MNFNRIGTVARNGLVILIATAAFCIAQPTDKRPSAGMVGKSPTELRSIAGAPDREEKQESGELVWFFGKSRVLIKGSTIIGVVNPEDLQQRMELDRLRAKKSSSKADDVEPLSTDDVDWINPWTAVSPLTQADAVDSLL